MLLFEVLVGPPRGAAAIKMDRLGEELIAVARQRICRDRMSFHRPEPSAACLVAQVGVAIGGADEDALPRLDNFLTAVARSIALLLPRNEGLEQGGLGACSSRASRLTSISHLPRRCWETSFPQSRRAAHQLEPLPAEYPAGRRLQDALRTFDDRQVVRLATRIRRCALPSKQGTSRRCAGIRVIARRRSRSENSSSTRCRAVPLRASR